MSSQMAGYGFLAISYDRGKVRGLVLCQNSNGEGFHRIGIFDSVNIHEPIRENQYQLIKIYSLG
jgi:hypothetical protein